MKIKLITQLYIVLSIIAMANPAPFGLEIEKTTIQELKQKYNVQKEGINKYSQGEMYRILNIDFDGIKQAKAIFDKNQKLVALYTVFEDYKFYDLKKLLSKHYQLIEDKKGSHRYVKFIDDKTEIILDNPFGFSMYMNYMSFSFKQQYEDGLKQEKEEKEQKERDALFGKRVKKVDNISSEKSQIVPFPNAENKVKEEIQYIEKHHQRAYENHKQQEENIPFKKIILYVLSNGYFYLFLYLIALWMLDPYSNRKMNFFKNFIAIIILIIIAWMLYLIDPFFLIPFGLPVFVNLMPKDVSNSNHYDGGGGGSCWGDDGCGDGGCGGE